MGTESDQSVVSVEGNTTLRKRIWYQVQKMNSLLLRSWRFGSFGRGAIIHRWDILSNPSMIAVGNGVLIRKGARLEVVGKMDGITKLFIGDGSAIQFYFHCGAAESVTIGKNVLIAGRVYITDHDHVYDGDLENTRNSPELRSAPVVIEDNVWLGEGCVVLKGVTIGKNAVIGANAVVTKDIPPRSVAGGIPARVIKSF